MYILRLSLLVVSFILSGYIQAAPTTELPPAPSAYKYIVVKHPTKPITKTKKAPPPQKTRKPIKSVSEPSIEISRPQTEHGRNPFSEGRKNP